MAAAAEKTEKPTAKRRTEARQRGQVAKSQDLNGAAVLMAGLLALSAYAPQMLQLIAGEMRQTLALMATPQVVTAHGIGEILMSAGKTIATVVGPIAGVCVAVGVVSNVAQVKWKPSLKIVKPDPKRLNPLNGAKNLFGPNMLFETAKNLIKVALVGAITATAIIPKLSSIASLTGMSPVALLPMLAKTGLSIAQRAAMGYVLIAIIDYIHQRRRTEKSLKMDKQEVKEEAKQHQTPPQVRSALRKRQMQAARARMMSAVPQADVVVTNPTHYAVALAYDGSKAAPEVIAKGQDLVAAQIRRIAEEHEIPVISDPPLARSLHTAVDVGEQIPEELFAAVAQLLAFVYRVAGRRAS
jgi:flagellar biosynthesis protein FlhB